jgi:hypothetical protein
MTTDIVSIGADEFGASSISVLLLAAADAGYVVLCVLFLTRIWRFPKEVWADTARPERAFSFFTFVAGSNVLGLRLLKGGVCRRGDGLAVAAALAWVLLAYGILARVVLAARKPEPEAAVNGTWLIWVVVPSRSQLPPRSWAWALASNIARRRWPRCRSGPSARCSTCC